MIRNALVVAVTALVGLVLGVPVGYALRPAPAEPLAPSGSAPVPSPAAGDPDAVAPAEPTPTPTPSPVAALEPVSCRTLGVDFEPAHVALTPDGRFLLLACREADKVVVWDWEKDEEEKRITVPGGPCFIFVRGKTAYVCNGKLSSITEVDLDQGMAVNTIHIPQAHPFYMSAAADPKAPLFISCGDSRSRAVVRLDPASEKSSVVWNETHGGILTIHTNGKVAVKQGDFDLSPSGPPSVFEIGPGWTLGQALGSQHADFGLLRPDREGKLWLGTGGIWDAGLQKQVLQLERGEHVAEHPTDPLFVALRLGDPFAQTPQQGRVTLYDSTTLTNRLMKTFALPRPGNQVAGRPNPFALPLVLPGSPGSGLAMVFSDRGNLCLLRVAAAAAGAAPTGHASRLLTPLPRTIPAGARWTFKLELKDPDATPRWKPIELPGGCTLDSSTGELVWASPMPGEHDLAVKVTLSPSESFLIEERLTVGGD